MAKRKTKAKATPDSAATYSEASGKASGGTVCWFASGKPLVRSVVDGVEVWRQPDFANEHNPEGITLAAVDMEVQAAFDRPDNVNWRDQHMIFEGLCGHPDGMQTFAAQSGNIVSEINFPDSCFIDRLMMGASGSEWFAFQRMSSATFGSNLVRDHDSKIRDLIKENPLALLRSLHAQDALARWLYATTWGPDDEAGAKAAAYLRDCLPRTPGRRMKTCYDLKRLRRSYDDLCQYVWNIRNCRKRVCNGAELIRYLPDAPKLKSHGLVVAHLFEDSTYKKPAPSDIATAYIAKYVRLSKSRIMDLVTQAGGASASK